MTKLIPTILKFILLILLFSLFLIEVVYSEKEIKLKTPITFLFVDSDADGQLDSSESLVIISADEYKQLFKSKVPLERMLRSQIQHKEFIVLNHNDIVMLDKNRDSVISSADGSHLYKIYFVKLEGNINGEHIVTTAELVNIGELKAIILDLDDRDVTIQQTNHEAHFKNGGKVRIGVTDAKVPWLGL